MNKEFLEHIYNVIKEYNNSADIKEYVEAQKKLLKLEKELKDKIDE